MNYCIELHTKFPKASRSDGLDRVWQAGHCTVHALSLGDSHRRKLTVNFGLGVAPSRSAGTV